ncbi:GPP34 family phosphoprotein [Mycobacterium sp. MYCO198283]|uniref:GOLPH3/VPS74 family protein n=1 Tax=Mycobacterium sp. MYCO198283 TaxID=2883505 RepID=UPI001E2D6C69|nr:GPP34 family phosphoprotein [Mycobacterium sp. MYCO198283]MCG5430878.1 GPP34 family phosphoprotein [Mycobacterium sp. MYCO198283]
MAQIAEELLLLLLDNAAARPALDRHRRERVLAGAVLLDLAYACRIRPAAADEPEGRLIALVGPDLDDPVLAPAWQLVTRRPLRPDAAIAKLKRHTEELLLARLAATGEITPTKAKHGIAIERSWPIADRTRVDRARAEVLATLFDGHAPTPTAAGVISLLHAVDGLGALLSLNDRGWRWVHDRASEIAGGDWVGSDAAPLADMNLAITASAVRPALV